MHVHRKGSMYKKILRKLFAMVVLLIGLRLLWVSVVNGLSPNVAMQEQKNAQSIKHKVKFDKYTERNGEISRTFTFSEVKGVRLKESVNSVIHTSNHSDIRGPRHNIGTIAPVLKDKHVVNSTSNTNGINMSDDNRKYHSKAQSPVNTNTNYQTPIEYTIAKPHTGTVDKASIGYIAVTQRIITVDKAPTENVAVHSKARKTGDKVDMKHINEHIVRQTYTHSKILPKRLNVEYNKSTEDYIRKPTNKANTSSSTNTKTATYHFNSSILMNVNTKSTTRRVSSILTKNKGVDRILEEAATKGTCTLVDNWLQKVNHANLSTYDLFDNVNYTMLDNGQYPIPVKSIEEINKEKTMNALTVILVPFSHADPGYGLTIEEYYTQMTHATLDNMIIKLMQYPNMTFQWAETVFLARWFQDLDAVGKENVRKLIQNGQLEIVLGGWVMPDEASTHYVAVVDQLIEGHQWLIENLGVIPKSAWVNDPFGYSSTMPYFWKASGMDNLLFLRINQPVKAKLMKMKSLEFMWRPYWKTTNQSDVLSSLMSYTNYWVSDVCGPEKIHCQEFNFLHLGDAASKAIAVTDANVAEQAKKLSVQFRITGDLYKYNTLYIGLGEDFSYPKLHQWDNMYSNYEKLINYINSQNWNMTVKFGTLSEYFTRVRTTERLNAENTESSRDSALTFPTLSGDFFPYTERNQEFWTGYFTTRPLNKRFSREIESLIRAADIFNVMVYSLFKYYRVQYTAYADVAGSLRMARQELGMFMHHDGITGTSLPHVVKDFEKRLFKANERAHAAFKMTIVSMLSKGKHSNPKLLQEETAKTGSNKMAGNLVIDTNKEAKVLLINTVARRRREVINLFVDSKHIKISSPSNWNVPYQVTVVRQDKHVPYVVSFEADLPAFGIEEYTFSRKAHAQEKVESREDNPSQSESVITIENVNMKVEFDKDTGIMKRIIHRNERVTNIAAQFMVYQSKTSGAYIFGPAGSAKAFLTGKSSIKVTNGPLVSEVKVTSLGMLLSVKLYNTSGIQGQGVYVKTEIDISAMGITEMEVILRFQTDVKNDRNFYTDQNGYQLLGRINRPENKIESNYYPVTTMGILEDNNKRFTLHCRQPHGGASLKQGQFEVMLDRHTFRDDKRGLGQGVYDNVKVNSDFILHIEHKTHHFRPEEVRYTYPSQDSVLMNELLQNGIVKYDVVHANVKLLKKVHPLKTSELPCGVSIVGFRNLVKNNLEYNSTSLVLHRKPLHCGYTPLNGQCSETKKVTITSLFPKAKVKISETSLSHLYEKQKLTLESDLTPDIMELRSFKIQI